MAGKDKINVQMCEYADVNDVQICICEDVQMFVNSDINAEL
ncbi:hypothetical protein [Mucilaginibacter sp. HD30]